MAVSALRSKMQWWPFSQRLERRATMIEGVAQAHRHYQIAKYNERTSHSRPQGARGGGAAGIATGGQPPPSCSALSPELQHVPIVPYLWRRLHYARSKRHRIRAVKSTDPTHAG